MGKQPVEPQAAGGYERWPAVVALAAAALLGLLLGFHRVWATDLWWQYKAGQYVLQHGWPTVDVFSYALTDEPWVELRWLFCVIQYGLTEALGPTSLIVAKCAVILLAFALVTLPVLRRGNAAFAGLTLAVALLAASLRFLVRPEMVSWLFAAIFVFLLDRWRCRGGRILWLLPVLQLVWVNMHTLWIFGPLLIGLALFVELLGPIAGLLGLGAVGLMAWAAVPGSTTGSTVFGGVLLVAAIGLVLWQRREQFLAPEHRRRYVTLAVVLVLCVLAGFVNPWGLHGFVVPFDQFLQISDSVYAGVLTEYQSPFDFGSRLTSVLFYEILIGLVVVSLLLNLRRLDPFWLLFCGSQLYLSTVAVRNLPLFCLAAVPFVVTNLERSPALEKLRGEQALWLRRGCAAVTVALLGWFGHAIVTDRYSVRQSDSNQFGTGFAHYRYPFEAMRFLEDNRVDGRIFATMLHAAYVLAHDRQIFADPRGDVYPDAKLEEFLRAQSDPEAWRAAVARYDIRVALVDPRSPLAGMLRMTEGWPLVWFDAVSAVFVRPDSLGTLDPIDTDEEFRRRHEQLRAELPRATPYLEAAWTQRVTIPNPYLSLTDFLFAMRRPVEAGEWLQDAALASPFLTRIAHRRVALAEMTADWASVIRWAPAALAETPDDSQVQHVLGNAYLQQRNLQDAKFWLEQASRRQPNRAATWALLGEIAIVEQDFPRAVQALQRAVQVAPRVATYRSNLARALLMTGDIAGAQQNLEDALRLDPNNVAVLHDLAQMHLNLGDLATARAYNERAWALAPGHPLLEQQRRALQQPR